VLFTIQLFQKGEHIMRKYFLCFAIMGCFFAFLTQPVLAQCDIDGDDKIGVAEAINALRAVAGLSYVAPAAEATEEQKKTAEDQSNEAVLALFENDADMQALETMTTVLTHTGLNSKKRSLSATILFSAVKTAFASCGSAELTNSDDTIALTFENACAGITGVMDVTPSLTGSSFDIEYKNININDCTISGSSTVTISGGTITAKVTEINACGQEISGDIDVTYSTGDQKFTIIGDAQNTFVSTGGSDTTTTPINFTYTTDGGVEGTLTLTVADVEYEISFASVKLDRNCNMPTAGTLTIDGTVIDFSSTTCENSMASVTTSAGAAFDVDLTEAKELLAGKK